MQLLARRREPAHSDPAITLPPQVGPEKARRWARFGQALAVICCLAWWPAINADQPPAGYAELEALFDEFIEWDRPAGAVMNIDYGPDTVRQRAAALTDFQDRLFGLDPSGWSRGQQADYLAVRARLDQADFHLNRARPWSRDPGFYVDPLLRLAFTELPVDAEARDGLLEQLDAIDDWLAQARTNLDEAAADYADLAIHNLSRSDSVGHGHPFREVPPAGVIGWYEDLLDRAGDLQPELVESISRALEAIRGFKGWLTRARPQMTAEAGIGREAFDWYLRQVKLMPYTSDEVIVLAERELQRTRAFYALERHRNREIPELELPASAAEYHRSIAEVDADIRRFLEDEEFITVPDYIPEDFREMGFNVPWIERPGGPNYWEQIQYRDPAPDHWHAVIPGHRFDGRVAARNEHPIRRHIRDSGRIEGWALYLEEVPLQLGFYEERPRTRELIYNFALFRAVRTIGDVKLQRNEMTAAEAVAFWMEHTPWLDEDVARVDAEIYLRRPPGYGLGYTIGAFQLLGLLADRQRQLGEEFDLKEFHDRIMAAGRIPVALLRFEMTGLDDQVSAFWNHVPLAELAE